ncbi:hypothetical protein H5P28_14860 [Ruficoccus amylovorans]|uniref:Uncharacterized protein n=1 Tax=Ruficoccus amylovorans TaxID=1804625 RepID=A0A842HFV1_9BACT|nr:hypothetical protein [Ruficoccus amylovorans]MBC2595545.1 hypothetical protein [Ruficoccus amylovorans]
MLCAKPARPVPRRFFCAPQPGSKRTIHATAPDGTPLVIEATGEPVTPQSGIRSEFTLQRDQAHSFGGLTSTHTSTDKDGNETTSQSQRIFWFLW